MAKKKIEVDEEDFKLLVRKITELEKKVNNGPTEVKIEMPKIEEEKYLFECYATAPYQVMPENQLAFNLKVDEFSKEMKALMKKYNFIKGSGCFLAKDILN